ncbi:hypothetical protein KXW36_001672, partial [Aspergillus fumigatus]
KNAILIIDFAIESERSRGLSSFDAIREASLLRFRPILMTTLAAALGALPLAIGFGDGAELRRPLGIAISIWRWTNGAAALPMNICWLAMAMLNLWKPDMMKRPIFALTTALALSGCSMAPKYHVPQSVTPAAA